MFKTTTTITMIGFTLMASLLMLTGPFANTNLFSDVMGSVPMNYDTYQKYIGYSDGYRTDSYHQQQQEASSNSYGYDNKKISYNNSYDDNKYSNYPTKINKYECQRGLFEGFFVSSPEFCNVKLPNSNLTSGFDRTHLYIIQRSTNGTDTTGIAELSIPCNPGDIAIDGQFQVFDYNRIGFDIIKAGVSTDISRYDVGVQANSLSNVLGGLQGHVICFDTSP